MRLIALTAVLCCLSACAGGEEAEGDLVAVLDELPLEAGPLEPQAAARASVRGTILGGDCHGRHLMSDQPRAVSRACGLVDAVSLHLVVTNFLGRRGEAIVGIPAEGARVERRPIVGYLVARLEEVDAARAGACALSSEAAPSAVAFHEVVLELSTTTPETYHYILETDGAGRVAGGRWCTDTTARFQILWKPEAAAGSLAPLGL